MYILCVNFFSIELDIVIQNFYIKNLKNCVSLNGRRHRRPPTSAPLVHAKRPLDPDLYIGIISDMN